jgi:hypothetical protein
MCWHRLTVQIDRVEPAGEVEAEAEAEEALRGTAEAGCEVAEAR